MVDNLGFGKCLCDRQPPSSAAPIQGGVGFILHRQAMHVPYEVVYLMPFFLPCGILETNDAGFGFWGWRLAGITTSVI